ncbi:MAG: dual specificity protein phosphatase family protein [Planctomycetes bacterium]|nr:dual specificity protein phosphatase family protein [Planctomycetota bacterium]
MMPKDKKTTKRIAIVVVAILACAGIGRAFYVNRWKVWPKRFAVVEPGWLYRGGQIDADLLEGLVDKYHIEAILALAWLRPNRPDEAAELALVRGRNLDFETIPMPGNGAADFDKLDEAADWIEAHHGHPIFVHCAAGVNRTGAAIVAYRVKHCGWALQEALAEARRFGMRDRRGELTEHLIRYYKEHLPLSIRLGQGSGTD